eukprot:CAMPEP_0179098662 /NCGR_PEP_ID=MMETSP0796-20121207/45478_1 /TAXON_ID=73915 /ORGANISM="Pyrodinium bahamense, Strain pbaha01" /LENGTH=141 /DNA_ID=CAMNT_0020796445 /DNA_START=80 /DNA_END=506 /DNA_ORIENTATION=+
MSLTPFNVVPNATPVPRSPSSRSSLFETYLCTSNAQARCKCAQHECQTHATSKRVWPRAAVLAPREDKWITVLSLQSDNTIELPIDLHTYSMSTFAASWETRLDGAGSASRASQRRSLAHLTVSALTLMDDSSERCASFTK